MEMRMCTKNRDIVFIVEKNLKLVWYVYRVGFLPEETYFFQDNGRNMVSSVFFHFLPEEMEEWDL